MFIMERDTVFVRSTSPAGYFVFTFVSYKSLDYGICQLNVICCSRKALVIKP